MLLRDTELIGKKLVKYGFYRSNINHHSYRGHSEFLGSIDILFKRNGNTNLWGALIVHHVDSHTIVKFDDYQAVFTPEWLREEHDKLQALFKFARL